MTNNNILTINAKIFEVLKTYYSTNSFISDSNTPISNLYLFIGNINSDDIPKQTQKYFKKVYKNIFGVKRISNRDLCPVVERIDWKSGIQYSKYSDSDDLFIKDSNDKLINKFYVRNSYDQIFICLNNNNNDSPSTIEPILEPGNYNYNNIITLSDGYKRKYIHTISQSLKLKFFNEDWIPIKNFTNTINPLEKYCGFGGIEVINVDNSGNNYINGINTLTITINGDGFGANAYSVVVDNKLSDIIVSNTGHNYTFANVNINSIIGSGAVANTVISPIGGFGQNILSDLGCNNISINVEIDENFPTNLTYYQLGIIANPLDNDSNYSTENFYWTTNNVIVSPGIESFIDGEYVYQGNSLLDSTYSAQIIKYDSINNILYLINNTGILKIEEVLKGSQSNVSRICLMNNDPKFQLFSGLITYIQNTSGIYRSIDGKEQLNLILKY